MLTVPYVSVYLPSDINTNWNTCSLYPGDLTMYTRKPLFVIVDSDNSTIFQELLSPFGSPLVVLMSPEQTPAYLQGMTSSYVLCPLAVDMNLMDLWNFAGETLKKCIQFEEVCTLYSSIVHWLHFVQSVESKTFHLDFGRLDSRILTVS